MRPLIGAMPRGNASQDVYYYTLSIIWSSCHEALGAAKGIRGI